MKRRFDDLQLGSLELFCAAAETGGFTAAAVAAGVTPAAVSRTIARMEARLGARLFVRTTRQIRLTEAGRGYFEHCKQALARLIEAEREVTGHQKAPSGTLRISVPTTYGHHRVLPLLPAFRARYPQIKVDVHVSNRNIDFARDGYDLAIRMKAPKDSGLVARRIEDSPLVVVASPEYLRRAGTPDSVEALQRHECIQFLRPGTGRKASWIFKVDGKERKVQVPGGVTCSDDVLGCVTLARAGAGLFQIMRFVVEDDLRRGSLIEVLEPFAGGVRQITLLYPHARSVPSRVRVFVDFLIESLRRR
jgi:DNA-binding transcriptional LysR family regulator